MPILPSPDCAFINKLAWRLAAGIAAGSALVAVALISAQPPAVEPPGTVTSSPAPPRPEAPAVEAPIETPEPMPVGGNIKRCIEFCAGHVTSERSIVVFENGTCVIVDEPCEQPAIDAFRTLQTCSGPNARFVTQPIEEGNCLVAYRRAAFHCVFSEEIASERARIEQGFVNYLTTSERESMPQGFDPPLHAKLGLVARSRLNADARMPIVAKIIRAKPSTEEETPPESAPAPPEIAPLPALGTAPAQRAGPIKLSVTPTQILPPKDAFSHQDDSAPKDDPPFSVAVSVAEIVPEDPPLSTPLAPPTPAVVPLPKAKAPKFWDRLAQEEVDPGIE